MTEQQITENLIKGGKEHDQALSFLFKSEKYSIPIKRFLTSKGMDKDQTNALWTDIIIKFGQLVVNGKYQHQNNLLGYIRNLSGYMCLNFFRDNKKYKTSDIEDIKYSLADEDISIYSDELKALFNKELAKLGDTCKSILSLWSRGYAMKEIAEKLKIISTEATRKRKHVCLKKLLNNIESNQTLKNTFKTFYEQ